MSKSIFRAEYVDIASFILYPDNFCRPKQRFLDLIFDLSSRTRVKAAWRKIDVMETSRICSKTKSGQLSTTLFDNKGSRGEWIVLILSLNIDFSRPIKVYIFLIRTTNLTWKCNPFTIWFEIDENCRFPQIALFGRPFRIEDINGNGWFTIPKPSSVISLVISIYRPIVSHKSIGSKLKEPQCRLKCYNMAAVTSPKHDEDSKMKRTQLYIARIL